MKKVVLATQNAHKLEEIQAILEDFEIEIVSMAQAGLQNLDIEETGMTFEENAIIKAQTVMEKTGQIAIADDSGLEVRALNGAPGIYSARFAGVPSDDAANNEKLLNLLKDVPDEKRQAKFVSVIAAVFPDGESFCVRGECPGRIGHVYKGTNGFGYDPLFEADGFDGRTFGELSAEEKNKFSHRANALKKLKEEFKKIF